MKNLKLRLNTLIAASSLLTSMLPMMIPPAFAGGGDKVGGGGDASEIRVDEIREDILKWIGKGGAKKLIFTDDLQSEDYAELMEKVLAPHTVIVTFLEKDSESDDELKVSVDGKPKTCRGFISGLDGRPHIICNIKRFDMTTESNQYKLIHHEFAGLAGVEKNSGASSDYFLSKQLTDFLVPTQVLRLSLLKRKAVVIPLKKKVFYLYGGNCPGIEERKPTEVKAVLYDLVMAGKKINQVSYGECMCYEAAPNGSTSAFPDGFKCIEYQKEVTISYKGGK